MKSRILIISLAAAVMSLTAPPTIARAADGKPDDVFLDEGTADDFAEPAPMAEPGAPAPKPEKGPAKGRKAKTAAAAPEPAPVAAPAQTDASEATADRAEETAEDAARAAEESANATAERAMAPQKPARKKAVAAKPRAKASGAAAYSGPGMFKTTGGAACVMFSQPSAESEKLIDVSANRKIWVEPATDGWVKGFRKDGSEGYLEPKCFN